MSGPNTSVTDGKSVDRKMRIEQFIEMTPITSKGSGKTSMLRALAATRNFVAKGLAGQKPKRLGSGSGGGGDDDDNASGGRQHNRCSCHSSAAYAPN